MFEFVQKISFNLENETATGYAFVSNEHPFFWDHFEKHPVLPATIAIEIGAQIAGPLGEELHAFRYSEQKLALLAMVQSVKLHRPVLLPANLDIQVETKRFEKNYFEARMNVYCNEEKVLNGSIVFSLQDYRNDWAVAIQNRNVRLKQWQNG